MKTLEKVSDFVGKYMAAIVIVVAALALLFPGTFSVVKTAWVNTLLGIVMFGMGADPAVPSAHRAGDRRHPCGYLPRRHLL